MNVAVVGGGIMGSGIAQLCAMHGHEVVLYDVGDAPLRVALNRIDTSVARFTKAGKLSGDDAAAARGRLATSTDLASAVAAVDVVLEAVPERFDLKRDVWRDVAAHAPSSALLGSNTSQLSITRLAATLPEAAHRFIGLHFFNPPVMMRLVEIVRGLETSDDATRRAVAFTASLARESVVCEKDSPGFITTRAYAALRMECLRIVEEGIASHADVDRALKLAFNLPMGPFELADFNGLDTLESVMDALAVAHGDRFRPTVGLRNTVAAGRLGRKTGAGFYRYPEPSG